MAVFRVACGQITWNNEHPKRDVDPLAEIAQAGYEGAPCGPRGDETAQELLARYAAYGLSPAPGYLSADFWDPAQREVILQRAHTLGQFMAEVGCGELYVASGGFGAITPSGRTRRQASTHVRPEEMLTDAQFRQFADVLNEVGRITLSYGVQSCFHNHVGSFIETREEIDRLFDLVDPELIYQGPDIGHLAWAGVDPVQFCRDYAGRIISMHLKDIDPKVLNQGLAQEWNYGQFSDAGIFAELGEGMVDFPAIFDILRGAGYEGWVVVETDRTTKATAFESAQISRRYLKSIGI
ncbi:MAG: TIM barrel protein [Anaerolineae bacterium]|nr:TIM barrel protein [Anaerolineae bacterium]